MVNPFDEILAELRGISDRLYNLEKKVVVTVEDAEYIDTKTLCNRLCVSEPTVIRWRKVGKIPFVQIDGVVRYDWKKVKRKLNE